MDERLFLNTKEQISEGTVSNVFFVRKGVICTPEVSCGLLPGILREYLCESEEVKETDIYVQDLKWYQECFVTNSLMGILPVRQIGGVRFKEDTVTKELMKKYAVDKEQVHCYNCLHEQRRSFNRKVTVESAPFFIS